MKKELRRLIAFDDHVGCFGEYNSADFICTRCCAINMRCAIELEQNTRLELLEEMVAPDGVSMTIQ